MIQKRTAPLEDCGLRFVFIFTLFSILIFSIFILLLRFRFHYVMSGSMEPTLSVGALIVVDLEQDAKVGDVAVYRLGQGYVAHRIVRKEQEQFIFRGDANQSEDPFPVHEDEVVGPVVLHLNQAAYLFSKIKSKTYQQSYQ